MRCGRAKGLYFKNRDGLLNEAEKMRLQEHLDGCPGCGSFVAEMDRCLDTIKALPECEPTENFEWNLKRRIVLEKAKLVRAQGIGYLGEWKWGLKFAASAAAVIVIVLGGVSFLVETERGPVRMAEKAPAGEVQVTETEKIPSLRDWGIDLSAIPYAANIRYPEGLTYPRGLRMVSNQYRTAGRGVGFSTVQPIQYVGRSMGDTLEESNELLKLEIQRLEKENLVLRRILSQERARK